MSTPRFVEVLTAKNACRHFGLWGALVPSVVKKANESLAAIRVFVWEDGDNEIDARDEALAAAVLRANMATDLAVNFASHKSVRSGAASSHYDRRGTGFDERTARVR